MSDSNEAVERLSLWLALQILCELGGDFNFSGYLNLFDAVGLVRLPDAQPIVYQDGMPSFESCFDVIILGSRASEVPVGVIKAEAATRWSVDRV